MIEAVESKRQEVLNDVRRKRDEKKNVLDEQLKIIQTEKSKVDSDVQVMQARNTKKGYVIDMRALFRQCNTKWKFGTLRRKLRISTTNWTPSLHCQNQERIRT